MNLIIRLRLVQKLRMSDAIILLPLYAFVAWRESFTFYLSGTHDRVYLLNIAESTLKVCDKQYTARKKKVLYV